MSPSNEITYMYSHGPPTWVHTCRQFKGCRPLRTGSTVMQNSQIYFARPDCCSCGGGCSTGDRLPAWPWTLYPEWCSCCQSANPLASWEAAGNHGSQDPHGHDRFPQSSHCNAHDNTIQIIPVSNVQYGHRFSELIGTGACSDRKCNWKGLDNQNNGKYTELHSDYSL